MLPPAHVIRVPLAVALEIEHMTTSTLVPNQPWWQRQQARLLVLYSHLSEKIHGDQWIKNAA
jgi:hypothetical protein